MQAEWLWWFGGCVVSFVLGVLFMSPRDTNCDHCPDRLRQTNISEQRDDLLAAYRELQAYNARLSRLVSADSELLRKYCDAKAALEAVPSPYIPLNLPWHRAFVAWYHGPRQVALRGE